MRDAAAAAVRSVPSGSEAPYVGLRPFEAYEKDLFFGRERDAQFLVDKILSARLTILYAQSGVGKSSLLHTLTIPELERESCFAVYVSTWPARDPLGGLKAALVMAARGLDVPDPEAGAPSLKELVQLVVAKRNQTVVVVLDQFEEVLAAPGEPPASLRRELSELVRSRDVDARIVIAMREEFLAALEPFRADIVNLFQSTYRLDRLDDRGVREAIVGPAKLFGKDWEPALVDQLVRDLPTLGAAAEDARKSLPVELPMLQLVCQELWAGASDRQRPTLTLGLYAEVGGAAKIISSYVRRTMPRRWSQKKLAARVLKFLAPPSGMKISYSVADLSAHTGVASRRIQRLLEDLCKSRILRPRRFQQEERFELEHDAFITILVPWRQQVLRQAARHQLAGVAGGLILSLLVAPALFRRGMDEYEYHREVRQKLPLLDEQCRTEQTAAMSTLEGITRHLLLQSRRRTRFQILKNVLASHEQCLPPAYGVDNSGISTVARDDPPDWPVQLRYSAFRRLDELYFKATWHAQAGRLAAELGVPVPDRLVLVAEATMPPHLVEAVFPGGAPLRLDNVPTHEAGALFSEASQSAAAREFLGQFQSDWSPAPELRYGEPWLAAPRWALPILAATRQVATDGSGYLALRLAAELRSKPELVLTPAAVELLLRRTAAAYPQTVADARAARGPRLRDDLIALVSMGSGLVHLPILLDALARYPVRIPSDQVAQLVAEDVRSPVVRLPYRAEPRESARVVSASPQVSESDLKVYAEVADRLPDLQPPIRVYLGRRVESLWTEREELKPEIQERIEQLRDQEWLRFGIEMPGVRFRRSPDLPAGAFRIEMLNQDSTDADALPIRVDDATAAETLFSALRSRIEKLRTYWVSAEIVSEVERSFDPALATWLRSRYSTAELKALARAVITPTAEELRRPLGTAAPARVTVASSHSVRHLSWLLQSLVFWAAVDDVRDIGKTAERLRATQAAWTTPPGRDADSPADVRRGLDALELGRIPEAETWFGRVVRADRESAIRAFLTSYGTRFIAAETTELLNACADPTSPSVDRWRLVHLRELVDAGRGDRDRKLCLYAAYLKYERPEAGRAMVKPLLAEYSVPERWPHAQAAWFGGEVLKSYDPLRDGREVLRATQALVKSAMVRLSYSESVDLFAGVGKVCASPGPRNWCWDYFDELARARPEGLIPAEAAWQLSGRFRPADLNRALEWASRVAAVAEARGLRNASPARHFDYARFSRAYALKSLAESSDELSLGESEQVFRDLLTSPVVAEAAHTQLIELLLADERYADAGRLLAAALTRWPGNATFLIQRFWVDLLGGNTAAAAATARRAESVGDQDSLFVAALGQVLTRSGEWEYAARRLIGSTHPYVDYIHMMLYASQSQVQKKEARELLDQRWARIRPATWPERLRGGDDSAWREMLIGYYVGEVRREELIGTLENDAAFAASPFADLPMPRQGLLCEAYFYDALLAKAAADLPRMEESLKRVLGTKMRFYFEYKMAMFLLRNPSGHS